MIVCARAFFNHRKYLSSGGRLVLINLVLSSLPIFMMSFFEIPGGVFQKLDVIRSNFFW
jgi:magnesium-transporting ATPase (P-type)